MKTLTERLAASEAKLQCVGCKKRPDELDEFVQLADDEGMTPDDCVRQLEGTYNPRNGHFTCTQCYVARGMPTLPGGWIAP